MTLPSTDQTGVDFARVDWGEETLHGIRFADCRFTDARLVELNTRSCVFENCDFTGARLASSRHESTAFLHCRFQRSVLWVAEFVQCKLTGSEFVNAEFSAVTVRGGDWSWVSLRGVDLHGLDLQGLKLASADLSDADLRETDLRGCDLDHVRLTGARLAGADLRGAQTGELDWRELNLSGVRVDIEQALAIAAAQGVRIG